MKNTIKFILIVLWLGFLSCKKDTKDPDPQPEPLAPVTGDTIKVIFEHTVNDTLVFNLNQKYVNPNLDTFKVSILKYYISNVVVTKTDNSTFAEANSYHLIDVSNYNSTVLNILNVPNGSYKSISFTLGVDSARNCSGAQSGELAPSDMFWSWFTGYIMFKLEGTSPQAVSSNKQLQFHIGGYGGVNKVQRNFNFNFATTPSNVSGSTSPSIHLSADINEVFKTPATINFATQSSQVSVGPNAKIYADNYADMIHFKHVHN
ncbi:MAG: hypothetical protein H0U95_09175 [Bacteroidetes bacterium]|nr:hypothetical protein [Bacteroidota bacterium]